MSDTPNSDEFKNFCDAHFTDADLASVRTSKYELLLGMYECSVPFDPQFVISTLDDVHLRDALFRRFTDSFMIPLAGEEATLTQMHNKRVDFTDFLCISANQAGESSAFWATCAGIAALSGEMEAARQAIEIGESNGYSSPLGALIKRAAELPLSAGYRRWVESVESHTVEEYLSGNL